MVRALAAVAPALEAVASMGAVDSVAVKIREQESKRESPLVACI
jgi:hypothetical protein